MVKISTGLRDKMLNGGVGGGLKGALALGFINIYSGPQPLTADIGATGTLLGTASVDAAGTGLKFDSASGGVINKSATENWKFNGAAVGTAGWFRFYAAGTNPANASASDARIDGSIAFSGADMTLSNISITVGAPNTIDVFQFTLPAQ